jgi:hypothetical protein
MAASLTVRSGHAVSFVPITLFDVDRLLIIFVLFFFSSFSSAKVQNSKKKKRRDDYVHTYILYHPLTQLKTKSDVRCFMRVIRTSTHGSKQQRREK